jgi:hypothetical protein
MGGGQGADVTPVKSATLRLRLFHRDVGKLGYDSDDSDGWTNREHYIRNPIMCSV